jgi:hypothetical protein
LVSLQFLNLRQSVDLSPSQDRYLHRMIADKHYCL